MIKIADFKKFVDGLLRPVDYEAGNVDACIKALLPSADDEIILYKDFQKMGKGLLREQLLNDYE